MAEILELNLLPNEGLETFWGTLGLGIRPPSYCLEFLDALHAAVVALY